MMVLILTREELESIVNMKDCIEVVEEGFKRLALGEVVMPKRSAIPIKNYNGLFLLMPAYIEKLNVLSTKIVTDYPENPLKQNLPTVQAWVLYFDATTGSLEAIMDGVFFTAMRTGAAGGVAIKYLARENAEIIGVFGAGAQARTQIIAAREVRDVKEVKVYDIYPEKSKRFHEELSKLDFKVRVCKEPRDVVSKTDIVITATTSKKPVFDGDWLEEGTHINSIGGVGCQELDEKTIKRAKLVVDYREAVLEEASDIIIPIKKGIITPEHIYAEIGEIALGKKQGRVDPKEITVFRTVGVAAEDAVTAKMVYEKAKERNVGNFIEI